MKNLWLLSTNFFLKSIYNINITILSEKNKILKKNFHKYYIQNKLIKIMTTIFLLYFIAYFSAFLTAIIASIILYIVIKKL